MNIWAHRGFSRLYPENTLSAFEAACAYDITGIELDVHLSADGVPVVIHDETVDRTTTGTGAVKDLSLEELKALKIPAGLGIENAGKSEHIPTLQEVLELCAPYCLKQGMRINIELKTDRCDYPGIEEKCLKLVRSCGLAQSTLWSSFNPESLKRMQALDPESRLAVLAEDMADCMKAAQELGLHEVHPYLRSAQEYVKTHGISVGWAVRAWSSRKEETLFPAPPAAGDGYRSGDDFGTLKPFEDKELAGVTDLITNNCDLYCEKRVLSVARLQAQGETQKLRPNCSVNEENGMTEIYNGLWTAAEPVKVDAGDILEPVADGILYRLYYYRAEIPVDLIRERAYRVESNWTTYAGTYDQEWLRDPYTVAEDGYLRIVLKNDPSSFTRPLSGTPSLDELLRVRRTKKLAPTAMSPGVLKEISRLEKRLAEQASFEDLRFVLCSDTHYTVGGTWEQTFLALKNVCRRIQPDGIIHLGDYTDGALPDKETLRLADRVLNDLKSFGLPLFLCIGNHDFNTHSPDRSILNRSRAEKFYLAHPENLVTDFPDLNVRMIFLASYDPKEKNPYGFSLKDVMWLNRVLGSTPKDSRIIVFSHVTPTADIHHWSDTIRNGDKMIAALEKRQKKCGNILAWICGHNHADQIYRKYAFPIVSIASMKIDFYEDREGRVSTGREKSYGGVAPERVFGEASQEAFDILVVPKGRNELRFLRFGAGQDRIV